MGRVPFMAQNGNNKFMLALLATTLMFRPADVMAARDIYIGTDPTNGITTSGGNPNTYTANSDDADILGSDVDFDLTSNTDVIITTGATGSQAGNITFETSIGAGVGSTGGLALNANGDVVLQNGIAVSIVGGDIDISSARLISQSNNTITSDSGTLNINISGDIDGSLGGLQMTNTNTGNVFVTSGGLLNLDANGKILATTGNVDVSTTGNFILGDNSAVTTATAGNVSVTVGGNLSLDDGAFISTQGTGQTDVTVTGDMDFTNGGTSVSANGALSIDVGGDLTIDNSGATFFSVTDDVTIDVDGDFIVGNNGIFASQGAGLSISGQNMTANGTLLAANAGGDVTLNFTDDIALTGISFGNNGFGVLIDDLNITAGGDLSVDATSSIDNNGSGDFNFNIGGTGSFAPVMSGTGNLVKTGAGSLSLTGANTYTGTTSVNAGRLAVNGSITSNTTVGAAGTLGGTGTITGSLANNGTVAPGNSIGTAHLTGNYTQGAGGIFEVEVDDAGNEDLLAVTGTAAVDGTLRILPSAGSYSSGVSYTILSASGGVSGTFDTITVVYGGGTLTPTVTYGANNILLLLSMGGTFADLGDTPNQQALGDLLQNAVGTGELANIRTNLSSLTTAQQLAALDAISGSTFGTENLISRRITAQSTATVSKRLSSLNGPVAPVQAIGFQEGIDGAFSKMADAIDLSENVAPAAGEESTNNYGFWLKGYGGAGSVKTSDYTMSGFTAGFDVPINETGSANAGVAVSYVLNASDLSTGANLDTNSYQLSLYGSRAFSRLNLSGLVGIGLNQHDSSRTITVGALTDTAVADYRSNSYFTSGEARYDLTPSLPSLEQHGIKLEALGSLGYTNQRVDDIHEGGGGSFNLNIPGQTSDSLQSNAGLGLSKEFKTAGGAKIIPEIYAGWTHEYMDNQSTVRASFINAPNSGSFTVSGAETARDSASFGAALSFRQNDGLAFFTAYDGNYNGQQNSHVFTAGLKITW